ncbi:hypothetical protein GCM10027612_19360 [Microbispora bryophytorum subsp. camponoti]
MAGNPMRQPGAGQTRRRGAALEEAILRAAVDELTESGYGGLTIDKVATRAGTNKNAIYRRWPNRLTLGIAAYRQLATTVPPPDTGNLRGDVLELLRQANRHWSSPSARSCANCSLQPAARRNSWRSCKNSPATPQPPPG